MQLTPRDNGHHSATIDIGDARRGGARITGHVPPATMFAG
jgi:hypothetical protein